MTDQTQTPAHVIFNRYWQCAIPQHHLYSKEYIKTFGIPTSGNKEIDRNFANSMVRSQLTIAEMAIVLDDGGRIELTRQEQSVEIYQVIINHLNQWKMMVKDSPGTIAIPMEDLRKLDNLANEVYKVARRYQKDGFVSGSFYETIQKLNRRAPISRKNTEEAAQRKGEHSSISDLIAKEAFSKTTRWR